MIFCDLETYSDTLRAHGTHRYAERAEVLLWAYTIDDGPAQCWDVTADKTPPADLLRDLSAGPHAWHNGAGFDRHVIAHALPDVRITCARMIDTMTLALMHGLPGSLGTLGSIFGLAADERKDKRGRDLIHLFCKPRPKSSKLRRATRETHPAEWAEFVEYAKQDVVAMRALYHKMPQWNWEAERPLWLLDQRINDRGIAVDVPFAAAAILATERSKARLAERTQTLTDGALSSTTQRDKTLAYLLEEHGVKLPDLTADTIDRRLADEGIPDALRELLAIRGQVSKTSTTKYKRLVQATSTDGRLRGALQFCGAPRTGRWAGRVFQPHNLPRPTHTQHEVDQGIEAIMLDADDLVLDDTMALASSAIRGAIVAPPGRKLVVADLSNIEGRAVAWLAGENWKLDAFRAFDAGKGADLYKMAYARAFAVRADAVTKDQRQIGKVMELMLGYEGGIGAFLTGAETYGIDLNAMAVAARPSIPPEVWAEAQSFLAWRRREKMGQFGLSDEAFCACDAIKRLWREAHPRIAELWGALAAAVSTAILSRNEVPCGSLLIDTNGAWLRIRLPSGRYLCYPSARVDAGGKLNYMGINQYNRKWQRLSTYGGKLVENVTQAVARDILASSMQPAEDAGYAIVLTVHDELVTEAPDTPEFTHERLAAIMATPPSWAQGLPLAAAGFETHRYRKD